MSAGETAQSAFWTFSLSVYASEAVSAACIALQDRCGLDVNMLLFALYAGSRGRSLSRADLDCVEHAIAPWRTNVVQPLRGVRRWLEARSSFPADAAERLRRSVLAREIEAEAQQQDVMGRALAIEPGKPDVEAAADNLLRYVEMRAVPTDDQTVSELCVLLSESFATVDRAAAKTLLHERSSAKPS
jgi:uncharacterized protein (TIGR02444 family)